MRPDFWPWVCCLATLGRLGKCINSDCFSVNWWSLTLIPGHPTYLQFSEMDQKWVPTQGPTAFRFDVIRLELTIQQLLSTPQTQARSGNGWGGLCSFVVSQLSATCCRFTVSGVSTWEQRALHQSRINTGAWFWFWLHLCILDYVLGPRNCAVN